jgi:glycosyltransferase involved in cell wall biosynthesis
MNCHDGERYLKNSILSILNQDYKKWELIFWDNQSKDKSKEIVSNFKDKRIKYFKSKNFTSLYKARNLAISKAKGEYISFLDTDDYWIKKKLFKQVELIKKDKNINFIHSNFYVYDQLTKKKKLYSLKKIPNGKITQSLLNDYKLGVLTVMMKRAFFKKKKFNTRYNIIGDFDYFIKLSIKENFFYINEPLAYYRLHKKNYSKNISIYCNELNNWLRFNSKNLYKKNFSTQKIDYYSKKLKLKKFFRLGP